MRNVPEDPKALAGKIQKFLRRAVVQRKRDRAEAQATVAEAILRPIPGLLEPEDIEMEWRDEL